MLSKCINAGVRRVPVRMFGASEKLVKFDWEDPLITENRLTEEEKMIRDTAR